MKATIERATLLRGLSHVQSVVERRNTIPILSNVLIEAQDGGTMRLMATDLDLQIDETIPAAVDQPGAITVSAHTLFDIVRKLPEGAQVELSAAEGRITVNAGRAKFTLATLPRDDFPMIAEGELPTQFEMPAEALKQIIDKTRFAISTEETRYYLNGIYLHTANGAQGETLRAVATDGHRLAQFEIPLPSGAAGMPGVIIPRKTVGEVQRLLDSGEQEISIELSTSKIRFTIGDVVLTSKLIDGTFPDYGPVIPLNNSKILQVDKHEFENAVDRVSTVSSERGRAVKLSLNGGKMTLSVNNPDSGSATEELEVEYEADALDIGFNSRYLLDIAAQIESETAVLKLADPGSPTLIQDKDGGHALYVLMPMRV